MDVGETMKSLDEFFKNTHPKAYSRKINSEHKAFLSTLYPQYPLKLQIHLYLQGYSSSPTCVICGGVLNKITAKTCSLECRGKLTSSNITAREKAKQTCLKKYGVSNPAKIENIQEKRLNSNIEKYGSKVSEKTRLKAKERVGNLNKKGQKTLYTKYGVVNPSQLSDHSSKCKKTYFEKSGVDHYTKTAEYKQKKSQEKYNRWSEKSNTMVSLLEMNKTTSDYYANPNDRITFSCNICESEETLPSETFKWRINQNLTPCSNCNGLRKGSFAEKEIVEFLSKYTLVKQHNREKIAPLEIDIFLPEVNVAIEYNGLYWHNDLRINKNYHINKTEQCSSKGIRLIHIFEDEWVYKKDIVKSRLLSLLQQNRKIYARQCDVKQISSKTANQFLKKNHIQGSGRANIHYGLEYENNLVAVMTFLNGDISKKIKGWELNRYCSELNTNVVGGGSRLLSKFISDVDPSKIISFADRRWSSLDPFYSKLGFCFVHHSKPNYWYFSLTDMIRKHRYNFRTNDNIAESERTKNYLRIWDCGSSKWEWSKK
jgi:hypothetical protein